MHDLISRQAAIDAFNTNLNELVVGGEENAKTVENYLNRVLDKIKCLPSALSTNLAEVGTDSISRQQAIGALRNYLVGKNVPCDGTLTCRLIENEVISKLPSAQPKRGRWLYCEDTTADCVDGYRCDQCGLFVPWDYQHKSIDYIKDYNFCPNCGSYNGGEQDDKCRQV